VTTDVAPAQDRNGSQAVMPMASILRPQYTQLRASLLKFTTALVGQKQTNWMLFHRSVSPAMKSHQNEHLIQVNASARPRSQAVEMLVGVPI
jgi:hypothetical protein